MCYCMIINYYTKQRTIILNITYTLIMKFDKCLENMWIINWATCNPIGKNYTLEWLNSCV